MASSTAAQKAADDTDRPVSTLHWLMVGGTGRPPRSYATLLRMARERVAVAAAEKAWTAVHKKAKGAAAAADEGNCAGPGEAGLDARKRPRNLLRWHREHEARNTGGAGGVEGEMAFPIEASEGAQQRGGESRVEDAQDDMGASNQVGGAPENVET